MKTIACTLVLLATVFVSDVSAKRRRWRPSFVPVGPVVTAKPAAVPELDGQGGPAAVALLLGAAALHASRRRRRVAAAT